MRVVQIVRRICGGCSEMHAVRFRAVIAVALAIIRSGRLSVTAVGRALGGRTFPKHSIKRVDRLLSNPRLQAERYEVYAAICRQVVGGWARPVILVDWTKLVKGFEALVAVVPIGGRGVTIYAEAHPQKHLNNARIHRSFLRALRDVLPAKCRPIIITDAGFVGTFFDELQKMGWDFVGRVRGRQMLLVDHRWRGVPSLYGDATPTPRDLGICVLSKRRWWQTARAVLVSQRKARKHPWRRIPHGRATVTVSGAKHPWLLVTSLAEDSAAGIVALYATRMQIEETFRDTKNHRFGWCLRHVRGYSAARLTVLLLLAAIAMLAVTLVGLAADERNLCRRYQANTVKKRVLSFFVLGAEVIRHGDHRTLVNGR